MDYVLENIVAVLFHIDIVHVLRPVGRCVTYEFENASLSRLLNIDTQY
jgi:hypothetical protein